MVPTWLQGHRGFFVNTADAALAIFLFFDFSMIDKQELRRLEKIKRSCLSAMPIDIGCAVDRALEVLRRIEKSAEYQNLIAVYYPFCDEMDTLPLIKALWRSGFNLCLPTMQGRAQPLKFSAYNPDSQLQRNKFGILEIVDRNEENLIPNILFVPLLAFDISGTRLGYGQGHYDVTIQKLRLAGGRAYAIGWAYEAQLWSGILPQEAHDQKLNMVITEKSLYDFNIEKQIYR